MYFLFTVKLAGLPEPLVVAAVPAFRVMVLEVIEIELVELDGPESSKVTEELSDGLKTIKIVA